MLVKMGNFWMTYCVFALLVVDIFSVEYKRVGRAKRRLKVNPHNLEYCKMQAKCETLNTTTCLGTKLPYPLTSLSHTGLNGEEQVVERLNLFKNSVYLPRCWPIIQPFLCAHFIPKCENDFVYLPSGDMCKSAEKLCSIFYNFTNLDLDCDDPNLFPRDCKNYIVDLNATRGVCMPPLIKTDQDDSFYAGVDGCGLSCRDPFYTESEHRQIHKLIGYCAFVCLLLALLTVCTFVIDWKTANKYPALAVFYINVCFLVSYGGWTIQFLGGAETRDDVVCKRDGTLRRSEPRATENLSCVIVFVMVYYFLIAGMVWFVIFTYCWYMGSLQALGAVQERVDKKRAYFHLVAWSVPLMLTITTMALGEIDGDYVSGVCFVGCVNAAARAGMLLAPLGVAISLGGYIIIRGLILLIRVKIESREIISVHSSRKIRSNIMRMGVFALLMVLFTVITFVYFAYRTLNVESWNDSLYNYIRCKIQSPTEDNNCKLDSRPSLAMLQLQLIAVFGSGIAMASWTWCPATVHSWVRYIRRKFNCELEEPMKLQKHKIIALAFSKRDKFKQDGRISIERQNSDPVGLNFELNSEVSTTWAKNLPRLVTRRDAIPNDVIYSYTSSNQSLDSEMSFSVRHVSIESRRNSTDSQVSVKIAELKATRKAKGRRHRYSSHKKHNIGKTSREIGRKLSKSSSSSKIRKFQPNLNRRTAISGIDGQHINDLLSHGKLVIPYNLNIDSLSEDENVSVSISESRFNMVLSNNFDLNDQLAMRSLRQGLRIEELKTTTDSDCSKKDREQEKRESRGSRRSRYSQRRSKARYTSDSDESDNVRNSCESSSCLELKQLVQSSLNSGVSVGCPSEKNRGSKQSKRSIDVAVQANASEIVTQTAGYDAEAANVDPRKHKTKQAKTKENKYKKEGRNNERILFEKIRRSKEKYKDYGSETEKVTLNV